MTAGASIYEFLRLHLDEVGRLSDPGLTLPDEDRLSGGPLRWAPGAFDGVLGHHAGAGESQARGQAVAEAFLEACASPTEPRLRDLYAAVSAEDVLNYLDAAIERIAQAQPARSRLHDLGKWLATTGSDRSAVKVGIAVLGVTGLERDVDVVRVLGAHDEFTLYAAVAMRNGLANPDSELWALAAAVDGWGRIECVERLQNTEDPQIRAWILRGGYRNSIMYEYLAYIAATTGGLLPALRDEDPDRELLTAAGEIIEALVSGGPAQDLEDYADGADAVEAFLGHLTRKAETLGDFHAVDAIRSYLERDNDWDELGEHGWTAARRWTLRSLCAEILGSSAWDARIALALSSGAPDEFWRANAAARRRGIDTFDILVRRIRKDPRGNDWFDAWQQADADRAEQLAALARVLLPLEEIASGPADELGLGSEWSATFALDWSLQALRDHPGTGAELIIAGLQSPVIRNRNTALSALKAWPPGLWPSGARQLVTTLAEHDPNTQTKEFANEVLHTSR